MVVWWIVLIDLGCLFCLVVCMFVVLYYFTSILVVAFACVWFVVMRLVVIDCFNFLVLCCAVCLVFLLSCV